MRIAYLNVITSAAPARRGEYRVGPVVIGIHTETDAGAYPHSLIVAIEPWAQWKIDPGWLARYGVTTDYLAPTITAAEAARKVVGTLNGVSELWSHWSTFHVDQLRNFVHVAAGWDMPMFTSRCSCREATTPCGIPDARGTGLKPPKLSEACQIMTGTGMEEAAFGDWHGQSRVALDAVRRVAWALRGVGLPGPLTIAPREDLAHG